MTEADFYSQPIINSPYQFPARHWQQDADGVPTGNLEPFRRPASFVSAIAPPRKNPGGLTLPTSQDAQALQERGEEVLAAHINQIRKFVGEWRNAPRHQWNVTPITAQLLEYWRSREEGPRPYFCQLEAVETAIWLWEVAPKIPDTAPIRAALQEAANAHNPGLYRVALKLATGAGKTLVMAMLIAWQTLNALHEGKKSRFSRAFLVVTPGLTIRDRLQVLKPNDPGNYYVKFQLVPPALRQELNLAQIVITNYHAFRLRELVPAATRAVLEGWRKTPLETTENPSQMLERVMPQFSGMRNIIVFNDEAHHCYQARPSVKGEKLQKEERQEAEKRNSDARLWISGLQAAARKYGISCIFDLSATPYYPPGSGWPANMIFPWTVSDFSLMDAIECGIVKLPRVPVADNVPGAEQPIYRDLWPHIREDMPKKTSADPSRLPARLVTALHTLYNHYAKVYAAWEEAGTEVPPCFIIVCNNTTTSRLVWQFISGYELDDGYVRKAELPLFSNFDENDRPYARPRALLIDSRQLEAGNELSREFKLAAQDEIERFKRDIRLRKGKLAALVNSGQDIPDEALLREVMNTVGKPGRLGADIRCVVSVGMLTEGWDADNVTHILGVRAFGSQLLCEQVIGRALRRRSHELNPAGLYDAEYADIFGIPFNFTAKPAIVTPRRVNPLRAVHAVLPQRAALGITFPRVAGYRLSPPQENLTAVFTADSAYELKPEATGPTETENAGIIGETIEMTPGEAAARRDNTIIMHLTRDLLEKYREDGGGIKYHLYGQLRRIAEEWLRHWFNAVRGARRGQILGHPHRGIAVEKILAGILNAQQGRQQVRLIMDDPPLGSSSLVDAFTGIQPPNLWTTDARKCQINLVPLDSAWEGEFCRILEKQGNQVLAYVKNYALGFEIPYSMAGQIRQYRPDFITLVDDGRGAVDPLHLIVEIKGYRREDAAAKADAVKNWWLPGVNASGKYGRWAFTEIRNLEEMESRLAAFTGGGLVP